MPELLRPDGCRLYYEVHGVPAAEPLLLLEGAGGDIPGWARNIAHLAETLHVIAYDHRGNGWSDAPDEPQTMKTFVDDAIAMLDNLEIERAHVYGQSFGGMVALELALARPERVRTLVLASTHAGGESVIPVGIKKGEAALAIFSAAYAAREPEGVRELFRQGVTQSPAGSRRQWEAMRGYDVADSLGDVTAPTLVLHGTDDRVIGADNARFLAEQIPGAELVLIEGAGHVYHWEQPEEADRAVLDFIGRHS